MTDIEVTQALLDIERGRNLSLIANMEAMVGQLRDRDERIAELEGERRQMVADQKAAQEELRYLSQRIAELEHTLKVALNEMVHDDEIDGAKHKEKCLLCRLQAALAGKGGVS